MGLADTVSQALGVRPPAAAGGVTDEQRATLRDTMQRDAQVPGPELQPSERAAGGFSADSVITALGARPRPEPVAPAQARRGLTDPIDSAEDPGAAGEGLLMVGKAGAHMVTGIGKSIIGGWRGLAALASGAGLQEAARQTESPNLAGGTTAEAYTPQDDVGAAVMRGVDSPYNPMNLPAVVAGKLGEQTLRATGSPAAATAVETGVNALPLLLLKGGKADAARSGEKVVGSGSIAEAPRAVPSGKPAALTEAQRLEIPTVLRNTKSPSAETISPTAAPERAKAVPGPEPTPVEAPKFAESAAEVAPAATPDAAAAQRAAVLQRIGIEDARDNILSADRKAAATDYQASKLDTSEGRYLQGIFRQEREALANHADRIIQDTGGTPGVDAHALEARGHTILAPLEAFKQWFTDKTTGLYNTARARMGDQPVALDSFNSVLRQDSDFAQQAAGDLRKGVQARMRELKMADNDGQTLGTVQQAEELRKYVNEQWSPQANGVVRKLKEALDNDVTGSAGEDVFAQARGLHAMKQSIFSDPKGISSILDSEGINRKVPVEKVADKITALPYAQFDHIVKTLENVPPELKAQAQAAIAEVKAQFANRLSEQARSREGQWGAKDVTRFLNQNGKKLARVFSPEEMQAITDLNDAGHILRRDQSYPGAAVQHANLVKRGAMAAVNSVGAGAGAVVGAAVGAPGTGASVGSAITQAVMKRFDESAALKAAQKRTVKLSDFPK